MGRGLSDYAFVVNVEIQHYITTPLPLILILRICINTLMYNYVNVYLLKYLFAYRGFCTL